MTRYPETAPEDMSCEQRRVVRAVHQRRKGGLEGPFVPLVYAPGILDHLQALGEHCRFHTGVPDKLRELAIIVAARHAASPYAFHGHAAVARRLGLAEDAIMAIAAQQRPARLDADEALVHDFCCGMCADGRVDDDVFERAEQRFGRAVIIDLVAVCGYYAMLALGINVTQPPQPPAFFEGYEPAFSVPAD